MQQAMILVRKRLCRVMDKLSKFAMEYKDMAQLGATHFQAAKHTTVGKRACLWLQDMLIDLEELNFLIEVLPFRGVKGTTGTQASFMDLFNGDEEKIMELDRRVASWTCSTATKKRLWNSTAA